VDYPNSSRTRTRSHTQVRQGNLSSILHQIRINAPISRAALAEETGLNKTTVSSLIHELMEHEFVREVGFESSGTGRPAIMLELNPNAGYILSAEVGVDFIMVASTNFAPEIIWRHEEAIPPGASQREIMDRVLALLNLGIQNSCMDCQTLFGIAFGIPGLVDQETGKLLFAPNLGWKNVPLKRMLEESFDAPIFIDNEANMAALGEHYFGAAQGYEEVLFISAGVGLGGGLVYNGQLFRGASGTGCEFGHMTFDLNGELCNCGNIGCWETRVSQRKLFSLIREKISRGRKSSLSATQERADQQLTTPLIVDAAHKGDKVSIEALKIIGIDLGIGIASLVNALNPELVVFGGVLSLAGDFILPEIEKVLLKRAMPWNYQATKVVLAEHGFNACIMGGVATVYQAVLSQPNVVGMLAGI
jgi:glucokinase-like ROK family protein